AAAAHRAGHHGGRGAGDRRRGLSSAAAQSARGAIRAGSVERCGAGCDAELDGGPTYSGSDPGWSIRGRGGDYCHGLFSRPARRAVGQRDAAAGRNYFGVVFISGHHVSGDDNEWPRSARDGLLAYGRSCLTAILPSGLVVFRAAHHHRFDLHHFLRPEFNSHGGTGGAASWCQCESSETGGVHCGVIAHWAGSFRGRGNRLRRPAGTACHAHVVWYRLPAADSDFSDWWRDHHRGGGHAGANGGGADGIAGGCDDGAGGRAGIYLTDAAESAMSAGNGATLAQRPVSFVVASGLRLKVEQASYAYAATDRSAPKFTLGPTTFEAQQRELVAILGPNASGKSTLLKLLAGVLKPLSGRIEVDGQEVGDLDLRVRAQRIALVQQESELLFPLRVWEYVLQGRYPYGRRLRFESEEDCLLAGNALAQVGADALRDRWMDRLSGREKQRVILARALAQQPALLLLDEPTQHLDIGGKVELLRRLRRLADENRYTVVVVTHELNLAAEFSDRIVLLQKGKCLRIGTPAQVYQRDLLE